MSVEISSYYDIGPNVRYANDQKEIERFTRQYGISPAEVGQIASRVRILDVTLRPPATESLMGTYQKTTWGHFEKPADFALQGILSSLIAPSLGDSDNLDIIKQKIESYTNTHTTSKATLSPHEQKITEDAETLTHLIDVIKNSNYLVVYIIARMHSIVPV